MRWDSSVASFFFQAEDGIRDLYVTGVQTCALPICGCDPAGRATGDAHSRERDRERRREGREQADPGGDDHPRSVCSRSTSSARRRRDIATISPSPTTTSDAATAMTAMANTWPDPSPFRRE